MPSSEGAAPRKSYKLTLAYDGTEFAGWQRQPAQRTVQGALEASLDVEFGCERRVILK